MDRTRTLDRRHRRILYGGLAVSAGIHVALLGVSFRVPSIADETMRIEQLAVTPFEAVEVVQFEAASSTAPAGAKGAVGPAADAAPGAPSASAAATPVAAIPTPPAPVVSEVAFERLTVFDPLSSAPIRPVEFEALRVAEASMPADSELNGEAEDDVDVYVPGSIGAAKRAWSGNTGTSTPGAGGAGVRIFAGVGDGGHCPMPGGRVVPPIWR